ncbi:MAG: gliding motility-associated C-terminal domain-containing protein [Bacteroidota bacterium]
MKPQLTIAFLLLLFSSTLIGQTGIELKVKILPDNTSFQVLARPNFTATNVNIVGSQVTLKVPLGGFEIGNITNHVGTWDVSPTFEDAQSGYEYFFLAPPGPIIGVDFEEGVEVELFSFENIGDCTGAMELFDNENDPLANSNSVDFANYMSLFGGGFFNEDLYLGNYNAISADCGVSHICEDGVTTIDILDIELNSPSQCGVADGSIIITAMTTHPVLPLQYSINGFNNATWQFSNVFENLPAGDIYEIWVRHQGGFCLFEVGDYELDAPLAAAIQDIDDTPPDCGMSNGTITITAFSNTGGDLEYGVGIPPVYQSSPTIENLPAGIHPLWVRDVQANCESQIASYLLEDCQNVPCSILDLEYMGSGIYQVSLTSGETINQPNDVTETLRVTLKVPTGGFQVAGLTSQVANVDFALGTTTVAPAESPDFDYVTVELNTPNTQDIPYFANTKIPLFTFENGGTCPGDSVYLITLDDPYLVSGADINHEISVSGVMLNDCIGEGAVECGVVPSDCDVTCEIDRLPTGEFRISAMTDNVNISGVMATTSGMLITLKTPTGGFLVNNLTNIIDAQFEANLIVEDPPEDPGFDYWSIRQLSATPPAGSPTYTAGQMVPFFTFENVGPCVTGDVVLVDNDDPVGQAVAAANSITLGQTVTILGLAPTIPMCLSSNASVECQGDPCATLMPGFQVGLACEGASIDFTNTTTSNETISSWEWNFGDGSATSDLESPSHNFSNSGNFEVSLTVTTNSGCEATYSEFVTVFPSPGVPSVTDYTDCGSGVEIEVPSAASIVWSPEDGLLPAPPTDQAIVTAHPTATTTYNVTLTTADGCATSTDITVVVDVKPDWKNATPINVSDCGLTDGQIRVTANHANNGTVEYSLDPNGPWQTDSIFTDLAAGDYNLFARNQNTGCTIASPFNPVTITAPSPLNIDNVEISEPTGTLANGSITVTASGGDGALQYTLVGITGPQDANIFTDLAEGNYTLEVTNSDGTCLESQQVTLTAQIVDVIVVSSIFEDELCESAVGQVAITLNADIQSATITGGAFSNETINGPTLTFDVDPQLGTNNYSVDFATTNGGVATVPVTITGTATPSADFTVSPTLCTGGEITLNFSGTASNDATFLWDVDGADIIQDFGNGTILITYNTEGIFEPNITVDDNGCQAIASNSLNITSFNPGIVLNVSDPSCNAGDDGSIDLSDTGGFNYQWEGPGIVDPTLQDQFNLVGGTYLVTVTDPVSMCAAEASAMLTTPTGISISPSSEDATACNGAIADGSVTVVVNGGTANFNFEIFDFDDLNNALQSITVGDNSFTFTGLPSDTYSVVVTDASGCTDVETIQVGSVSSEVTTTATSVNADCTGQNGKVSVTIDSGTAPYSYQYFVDNVLQNEGPVNGTELEINGVPSGTVVVVITDQNGCDNLSSFTIAEGDPDWGPDVTAAVVEPVCGGNNGSISLQNLPANAVVSWASCPTCTTGSLPGIGPGTYAYSVFDINGCQINSSVTLNSTDGPEVEIISTDPSDCGSFNGGVQFQVIGQNPFSYRIIGNGIVEGNGLPNIPIDTFGLGPGPFTIEVEDLVLADCKGFESDEIEGDLFVFGSVDTRTTLPSDCGVEDATIEVEVEFQGILNITTSKGNAPDSFSDSVLITDLYDGLVDITLSDPNSGCEDEFTIDLGQQPEPVIDAADYELTDAACPNEMGSIVLVNPAIDYFNILTAQGVSNGVTSLDNPQQLQPGSYNLVLIDGNCTDTTTIDVIGPADWDVTVTTIPEGCDFEDGSISLLVSGGTGDYTFEWENTSSDSSSAVNLSAGEYALTITDESGCEYESIEFVDANLFDCENPCEDLIFFTDTIYVNIEGNSTKICLPTELDIPSFAYFDLVLDGSPLNISINECNQKNIHYSYAELANSMPPYRVELWEDARENISGFEFNTIEELLQKFNEIDPTGNWVMDENVKAIVGGDPNFIYGELQITAIPNNQSFSIPPISIISPNPSISVDDNRTHILIATDPANADCADTLYINLLMDGMPSPDTMFIGVEIGEILDTCLDASELSGVLQSLQNYCPSAINNAQWLATGDECIQFEGLEEGTDEFCFILCNDNGLCDTTTVIVDVIDPSTEIVIFTGFSPNNDEFNEYFRIKNIELYPNNKLTIFNRWGNKIYSKRRYTNADPWRGIYKNTHLTDGTYFYILEVEIDGTMNKMTGYVQISR